MRTLVLALVVMLGLQGCAATEPASGTVTVLALWSGVEQRSFEQVLKAFKAKENIDYRYVGTRAIGQVLQSEVQKGTPPDIAILSTPGEFASFVRKGYVQPLDEIIGPQPDQYSPQWRDLESAGTGKRYAVTVKADLKSTVWYNPARPPARQPQTLEELQQLGAQWCVGMSATPDSGWPGSDWIEDILLHQSGPEAYARWASGQGKWTDEAVERAWTTWGELLGQRDTRSALLTEFPDAGDPMFTKDGCQLDHQPSFIVGTYVDDGHVAGQDFDFFPFPRSAGLAQPAPAGSAPVDSAPGDSAPMDSAAVVSADLAGMFHRTPEAEKLMRFLASAEAQSIWPRLGGAFSVNLKVDLSVYKDDVRRRIAKRLTSDQKLCFDASDLMPPALRTNFYRAALEYINDRGQLGRLLRTLDSVQRQAGSQDWLSQPCGR